MDPFRKVWHEEYRREVEEVIASLRGEAAKPSSDPIGPVDAVIPPARVFEELKASREKLAELLPIVEDLRHRLATADGRIGEELRRREKLKDVIVRLNFDVRKLESELNDGRNRCEAGLGRLDAVQRKLRESEAGRAELAAALERSQAAESQLKGVILSLRVKADEVQAAVESRDIEVLSLKKRYEAACSQHAVQLAERENDIESALRRVADKQVQLERALAERDTHGASTFAVRNELAQRLAEVSRLTVELQGFKEGLRTERETVAQTKACWDAEIERRRQSESRIQEAVHQLALEREASAARFQALEADRERFRLQAHEAIQRAESETLRSHALLEEARRFETDCAAMFRKQMSELQDERDRLRETQRKELAQAQEVKDQGLAALEAAARSEDELRRREEEGRQRILEVEKRAFALVESERSKLKAEYESAAAHFLRSEVDDHESLEAERVRLKAEYDSAVEDCRRAEEAVRADLSAARGRLQAEFEALSQTCRRSEEESRGKLEAEKARLQAEYDELTRSCRRTEDEARRDLEAEKARLQAEYGAMSSSGRRGEEHSRKEFEALKARLQAEYDSLTQTCRRSEDEARARLGAEKARLQAEYDALAQSSRQGVDEARRELEAERTRLRQDVGLSLEKAQKVELDAVTQVAEMERLIEGEKARMKSGVREALEEVQRVRAEAAEAAAEAERSLSRERAKLDQEKARFLADLDAERRRLFAEVEAQSAAAEKEAASKLEAERSNLRKDVEEEARLKAERARLHREREEERAAMSEKARAELSRALEPSPAPVQQAAPAPVLPPPAPAVVEPGPFLVERPVPAPTDLLAALPETPVGSVPDHGAFHGPTDPSASLFAACVPAPAPALDPAPSAPASPDARTGRSGSAIDPAPSPESSLDTVPDARTAEDGKRPRRGMSLLARLAVAALVAAAAAAAGAGILQRMFASRLHPVPFKHPTALVWAGGELWVSDWYDQAVYRMAFERGRLEVRRRYVLPGSHVTGMALDKDALYLADSWKRQIIKYRLGDELVLEGSWPSPGPNPGALSLDGRYLWSADSGANAVYRHALDESLTILNTYPVPFSPVCIQRDGGRIWSAAADGRMIFRLNEQLGVAEALVHPRLEEGWQPLSCLAEKDGRFWFGRDGLDLLVEIPRASLRNVPPPAPPRSD